jgi:hypothetical protein
MKTNREKQSERNDTAPNNGDRRTIMTPELTARWHTP